MENTINLNEKIIIFFFLPGSHIKTSLLTHIQKLEDIIINFFFSMLEKFIANRKSTPRVMVQPRSFTSAERHPFREGLSDSSVQVQGRDK